MQPWQVRQQEPRREEIMVIFVEIAAEIMLKVISFALRKRERKKNLRNNKKIQKAVIHVTANIGNRLLILKGEVIVTSVNHFYRKLKQ